MAALESSIAGEERPEQLDPSRCAIAKRGARGRTEGGSEGRPWLRLALSRQSTLREPHTKARFLSSSQPEEHFLFFFSSFIGLQGVRVCLVSSVRVEGEDRMVVRLRLARFGRYKFPFYRIYAADHRAPRDGKHLEILGHYDPIPQKDGNKHVGLHIERIKYWLSVGAQPSKPVARILSKAGEFARTESVVEWRVGWIDHACACRVLVWWKGAQSRAEEEMRPPYQLVKGIARGRASPLRTDRRDWRTCPTPPLLALPSPVADPFFSRRHRNSADPSGEAARQSGGEQEDAQGPRGGGRLS